mmetsp:Transcript_30486/g.49058  ORF Transcript_30486/g.49058 Transcript_30486/m.49058 type:complete len:214 (+) Transcript_30486:60-701(+)
MAQSLLQILQCRILLIFLMIDPGQQKVGISRAWIQTQALMQDAGGRINLIESHLRFRQQHLCRHQAWHKARQGLQHLHSSQEVSPRLRSIVAARNGVLQILTGNFQHEIRIELDKKIIAHCRLEIGDVERQGFVQKVQCSLCIPALAPSNQRLQESQIWRLPHGDLNLTQEFQLFLCIVQTAFLNPAVDDTEQGPHISLIFGNCCVEGLLSLW